MKYLKEIKIIIGIVLLLLALILIRSTGMNHFQPDAGKHAGMSVNRANILTGASFASLTGDKLLIALDSASIIQGVEIQPIQPASILAKNNLRHIMKHKGPVIISSSSSAKSARIWMLLSQMGRDDLYILSKE
jgi:hypothetical protein